MLWPPPALSVIVFSGVVLAVIVAVTAYRQRPDPMAIPVAMVMATATIWALPAAVGFAATDLSVAIRAEQARYVGTVLTPLAFWFLAMRYADLNEWIRPSILAVLSFVPAITFGLVMTNTSHGLMWQNASILRVVGGTIIVTEPGVWFPVHAAWSYTLMLVSLSVLGREVLRVDTHYRNQAGALFLGGLIPFLTNFGHHANLTASDLDLTPVALAVSGAIFAVALFRFDLIQLGPIARNRVIEEIPDGVVVIDTTGTVREFNTVAVEMFDGLAHGRSAEEVIPPAFAETGGERSLDVDGESKRYRSDRQPFHDNHGRIFGELLYLRDVSAIAKREQRISVLNRVLRHNVRNELMIQLGNLELLREGAEDPDRHLETIESSIHRVQRFADQARLVDRTLRDPTTLQPVALDAAIEAAIAGITREYPDANIEFAGQSDEIVVEAIDRELLEWVIAELIENARLHGVDPGEPITVTLTVDDANATVSILDSGPGIPPDEIAAIQSTVETALEHGSGVGLWLARWTAQLSDGELRFHDHDGKNAVSLVIPRADSETG